MTRSQSNHSHEVASSKEESSTSFPSRCQFTPDELTEIIRKDRKVKGDRSQLLEKWTADLLFELRSSTEPQQLSQFADALVNLAIRWRSYLAPSDIPYSLPEYLVAAITSLRENGFEDHAAVLECSVELVRTVHNESYQPDDFLSRVNIAGFRSLPHRIAILGIQTIIDLREVLARRFIEKNQFDLALLHYQACVEVCLECATEINSDCGAAVSSIRGRAVRGCYFLLNQSQTDAERIQLMKVTLRICSLDCNGNNSTISSRLKRCVVALEGMLQRFERGETFLFPSDWSTLGRGDAPVEHGGVVPQVRTILKAPPSKPPRTHKTPEKLKVQNVLSIAPTDVENINKIDQLRATLETRKIEIQQLIDAPTLPTQSDWKEANRLLREISADVNRARSLKIDTTAWSDAIAHARLLQFAVSAECGKFSEVLKFITTLVAPVATKVDPKLLQRVVSGTILLPITPTDAYVQMVNLRRFISTGLSFTQDHLYELILHFGKLSKAIKIGSSTPDYEMVKSEFPRFCEKVRAILTSAEVDLALVNLQLSFSSHVLYQIGSIRQKHKLSERILCDVANLLKREVIPPPDQSDTQISFKMATVTLWGLSYLFKAPYLLRHREGLEKLLPYLLTASDVALAHEHDPETRLDLLDELFFLSTDIAAYQRQSTYHDKADLTWSLAAEVAQRHSMCPGRLLFLKAGVVSRSGGFSESHIILGKAIKEFMEHIRANPNGPYSSQLGRQLLRATEKLLDTTGANFYPAVRLNYIVSDFYTRLFALVKDSRKKAFQELAEASWKMTISALSKVRAPFGPKREEVLQTITHMRKVAEQYRKLVGLE